MIDSFIFECWQRQFFGREDNVSSERIETSVLLKISYPCFIYGNNPFQELLSFCLVTLKQLFCYSLAICFLLFTRMMMNSSGSNFSHLQSFSNYSVDWSDRHSGLMCNFLTYFSSILFQNVINNNLRCVVWCSWRSSTFWVVLCANPTFTETSRPPWHCVTIHYTIPKHLTQSIVNFSRVLSS